MTIAPQPERSPSRVLTVDFWRGLALLSIFVNHMPGNVFEHLTHKNFGFSDATEVFVLLAGVAAAFVYLPLFRRGEAVSGTFRIVQRAFQLYMAQIVLIVLCAAVIARSVAITGDLRFYEMLHLDILINDTVPGLVGLATLGLQPAYLNILPLYIVLLLGAPAAFWLLSRHGPRTLLLASAGLYVVAQLFWLNLSTFPADGWWFLNPLCWQLLFVIGILIGDAIASGRTISITRPLRWSAAAYVAVAAVWIVSGFYPSWNPQWLPRFIWDFDKTNLYLPRLLHVLALACVLSLLPMERWLRASEVMKPLLILGRHSLPVFCLGTVWAIAGQMIRTQTGGALSIDVMLVTSGILAQIILAGVLEWHRSQRTSPAASRRSL
ncbi:OpgC family protein [Aureimonas leprariae]|uniref:OpgC family protein n=1 Tax=Plantimonas leprariae TaxID=2615207 RepID=UPI001386BB31|nr:OpgC domain-containing protein [Aureimonas leprariae]